MLKFLFSLVSGGPLKLYGALGSVILVGLIVGVHLIGDKSVRHQRDVAVKALNDYVAATNQAAAAREKENAVKQALAQAKLEAIESERQQALDKLAAQGIERAKSTQAIKELYAKLDNTQTAADRLKSNYDERLRLEAVNSAARVSEAAAAAEGLAASGGISDATAFATLEAACKITTVDFNTCRELLDADTLVCERARHADSQ